MSIDLEPLASTTRLLFSIELTPLQGDRFQPTGFPSLGAATYQTREGLRLLVESAQSMANRMETTCWDRATNAPVNALAGTSHVTVNRKGAFFTDTMLEAHRLNSPYLLEGKDKTFFNELKERLGGLEEGPVNRKLLAEALLHYDVGSLIHGVFLAKKDLAGGRLRVSRALSSFVEADGVRVAASGGVKNDHVNPSGDTKAGYGNVPFARDEFTAESIVLNVNLDLAQIRGYGLGEEAESLLTLLSLHRLRRLLDGDMRFRTACDLRIKRNEPVAAIRPEGFALPPLDDLEAALPDAIDACQSQMTHTTVTYDDALKTAKDDKRKKSEDDAGGDQDEGIEGIEN
jgi:CRISPR-associated protein Csb1